MNDECSIVYSSNFHIELLYSKACLNANTYLTIYNINITRISYQQLFVIITIIFINSTLGQKNKYKPLIYKSFPVFHYQDASGKRSSFSRKPSNLLRNLSKNSSI